ncbi:MAG: S-layer homology domain-containing protein, partial [Clostridiales bacterium]|nr:S-layer homology domain-containing protein [Clostridiales bacterium]
MKKKFLVSLTLILLMICISAVPAAAAEYDDIDGHWAEEAIERWSDYGIVQGYDGRFDPSGLLTRGQMAAILCRLLQLPEAEDYGFADVSESDWFFDYVNRCAAAGIMKGDGTNANPDDPITREQAMVMLGRALQIEPLEDYDLSSYADDHHVSDYAVGYVAAMVKSGIVNGTAADLLSPQANIDRASKVTILHRAIPVYINESGEYDLTDREIDGMVLIAADHVNVTIPDDSDYLVSDTSENVVINGEEVEAGSASSGEETGKEEGGTTPGTNPGGPVTPPAPPAPPAIVYYTATFVANGEPVDTVQFAAGSASVEEPEVPAKAGYIGTWEEYELTGDVTIHAVYTAENYIAMFLDGEGGIVAMVPYTVESESIAEPEVPAKTGYTGVWEDYEFAVGGITVEPVYTAIEYKAVFKNEAGGIVDEILYTVETESIEAPAVPAKEGYRGEWNAYELVIGGVTVEPVYTAITYTAIFVDEAGETVAEVPYTVESESIAEPEVPAKVGYTAKWSNYAFPAGGITVEPVYTAIQYTATFMDGSTLVGTVKFTVESETLNAPNLPGKIGHTAAWEPYVLGAGNITVNAVYTANRYTVTFEAEGEVVDTVEYV